MTGEERSELCLAVARVLCVNGQATDVVVATIRQLGNKLGINAELLPRWGELQLRVEGGGLPTSYLAADPVGVDMDRVASAMQAVMDIEAGRLSPEDAGRRIDAIGKAPPAPAWLFALAAAAGAVALAIIFGIQTPACERCDTSVSQANGGRSDIQPRMVALDASADIFAGNENDRAQVRGFITLNRALAIEANAAVIIAADPSLTGINLRWM
jgi:Putative threonine/serine exporter